jgi:hypothetical protein
MGMKDLHKAAHVSAFVLMWQIHRHVDDGDSVLSRLVTIPDAKRETDVFHTDAVDGDPAFITLILRVFKGGHGKTKFPLLRLATVGRVNLKHHRCQIRAAG